MARKRLRQDVQRAVEFLDLLLRLLEVGSFQKFPITVPYRSPSGITRRTEFVASSREIESETAHTQNSLLSNPASK